MIAHGRMIKQQMGADTRVVFLGPCIAKKQEALDPRHADCIDAVLNFNDISRWLNEEDILIEDCEDTPFERMDPRVNRLYPVTSGHQFRGGNTVKAGPLSQVLCTWREQLHRLMPEYGPR